MESVRVQLSGNRIKAAGRIIGGACSEHPAFSASYDLVTDETGVTRRLSLRTSVAGGEKQASVSRDDEGYWMIENSSSHQRSTYNGALDVDVVLSPFFNTLPIRRLGLHTDSVDLQVPVVYVNLLDLSIQEASLTYSSGSDGIHVLSPVSSSSVTVDSDGFVLDYPGLAERI
ncbi:putative glycolipid-binding domain-containing protein [Rhodococcoides yunnanense]|uniref:putative glycolipid-binding domain-containing protein n=1 Tax=Rhodococcoides yunnanense TaxID=278209 RepID=UPI000A6A4E13|nr:putative glycolipid-binding domain-containing protein [Rhodococcus yunnanensis]